MLEIIRKLKSFVSYYNIESHIFVKILETLPLLSQPNFAVLAFPVRKYCCSSIFLGTYKVLEFITDYVQILTLGLEVKTSHVFLNTSMLHHKYQNLKQKRFPIYNTNLPEQQH